MRDGGLASIGNDRMRTMSNSKRNDPVLKNDDVAARAPTLPGEVLREEFLKAYGITQERLADAMGVSRFRVNEVINGKRAVTAETALLLAVALGTSPEFWLNLQRAVDLHQARTQLSSDLKSVTPLIAKKSTKEIFYNLKDE